MQPGTPPTMENVEHPKPGPSCCKYGMGGGGYVEFACINFRHFQQTKCACKTIDGINKTEKEKDYCVSFIPVARKNISLFVRKNVAEIQKIWIIGNLNGRLDMQRSGYVT